MTVAATATRDEALAYRDGYEHLAEELEKLDLLIELQVAGLRSRTEAEEAEAGSRHLFVSHREVDRLLARGAPGGVGEGADGIAAAFEKRAAEVTRRLSASADEGVYLPLPRLARIFGLSPLEVAAVVICLAPELERKYDRLYAYLQDDITRKKPSVDLALRLLCGSGFERWRARVLFAEHATLLRAGILETAEDLQSPSGTSDLARMLKLDGRVLSFLLENPALDPRLIGRADVLDRLPPIDQVPVDADAKSRLLHLVRHAFPAEGRGQGLGALTVHLHGPRGVGKQELAMGVCAELGCPLLVLDAELLPQDSQETSGVLRMALREGLLQQAAVFVGRADALLVADAGRGKLLARAVAEFGWLTFLAGETPQPLRELFHATELVSLRLPMPAAGLREDLWRQALPDLGSADASAWPGKLAARFQLTPGQVRDACRMVANRCRMSATPSPPALADFYAACREQSNPRLAELATKVEPRYDFQDIILPPEKIHHLREICDQVRHRHRVFGDWGFERKLSRGKGLSALFSGPPGTGKTMAAEVLAHELKLDLYKIDLSGVVSKYIGETEKNLSRIFREAETSNAILFFDEADALFGKRTEVQDAHDRYANIETSFLLQKMEEFEGVTVLATNLQQNIDSAFLRRIRFVVEFPFPDAERRREIWKNLFPRQAPLSDEIDYELLAEQFQIAGGNIRNVVLNAAFLAAQNGGVIEMDHVLRGTRREYEKIGKLWHEPNKNLRSKEQRTITGR